MHSKLFNMTAADYENMFNPLYAAATQIDPTAIPITKLKKLVTRDIAWAKDALKKNNRIIWYLRWLRFSLEKEYAPALSAKDLAIFEAKNTTDSYSFDAPFQPNSTGEFQAILEHLFSLPIPEVEAYEPGYKTIFQVVDDLQDIEAKWQETQDRILRPQLGDKELINFPDGWIWWLLNRHACDDEARAMGNCGNRISKDKDQRILSLRQPKGKNEWEPHLTFILESDGTLGEMKGRNNAKPVPKYFPYIIALLKNPIVTGITGGGYEPEKNFSMQDLPEEERNQLFKLKPKLMTTHSW